MSLLLLETRSTHIRSIYCFSPIKRIHTHTQTENCNQQLANFKENRGRILGVHCVISFEIVWWLPEISKIPIKRERESEFQKFSLRTF